MRICGILGAISPQIPPLKMGHPPTSRLGYLCSTSSSKTLSIKQLGNSRGAIQMARMRTIKPEFFEDTKLAETPIEARYLYAGLWCWADRQGVFELDPKLIKKNIFPYDETLGIDDVKELLAHLVRRGIIMIAQFQGKGYGLIPKFLKHQSPHHKEHVKYHVSLDIFKSLEQAQGQHGANPMDLGFMDLRISGFMDLGSVTTVAETAPAVVAKEFKSDTVENLLSSIPEKNYSRWLSLYGDEEFIAREVTKAFGYYSDNPKKQPKSQRGWLNALSSWLERGWGYRAKNTPGKSNLDRKTQETADWINSKSDEVLT